MYAKEILMKLNYVFYDDLLDKYYKIWDKVNNSIKKGFHSEPINNKKYLKDKYKIL